MKQAVFQWGPFDRNLAVAVGSALRRGALASVRGTAVTAVKIGGLTHEHARPPGVRENALQIIENLRALTLAGTVEAPVWLRLAKDTPGEVTAADFGPSTSLSFPDPSQRIATLGEGAAIRLEVEVRSGVGHRPAGENGPAAHEPGTIAIDATFSPVTRAWLDLDGDEAAATACLGVETDGALPPARALAQAAAALLADLESPFDSRELSPAAGRFTSRWLPPGRANTLGGLFEAGLLFGGADDALDRVDVSFRIEAGDFLDHAAEERLVLTVKTAGGAPPAERVEAATSELQAIIRAAQSTPGRVPRSRRLRPCEAGVPAERRFERVAPALDVPDPLAIQRESFERFLSADAEGYGLGRLLREALTVDCGECGRLELLDGSLGGPCGDAATARRADGTFSRRLSATVRLTRPGAATVEQRLHIADVPVMTGRGSFLVRGRERICICQLVLAPGVYFTYRSRAGTYAARVVPHHGEVVRFEIGPDGGYQVNRTPRADPSKAVDALLPKDELGYSLGDLGRARLNERLPATGTSHRLEADDVAAIFRTLAELGQGRGEVDDLNHMKNLIVRPVGASLFQQMRPAFCELREAVAARLRDPAWGGTACSSSCVPPVRHRQHGWASQPCHPAAGLEGLISGRVRDAIDRFFFRCMLVRDLNTTNALAMVTQARQVTRCGPGGLDRKRTGLLARYVHPSHYGRLCVIDTPEGENLGLLRSLSLYVRLDEHGFVLAPYQRVSGGQATGEIVYLSAAEEDEHVLVAGDAPRDGAGALIGGKLIARKGYDYREVRPEEVEFVGVSPHEILGAPGHAIPFIEHDDPNRALMGANMSRQAVPILKPERPIVATGCEEALARGVSSADGDRVDPCAPAPSDLASDQGAAPGRNLLVAYVPWEGYNYEDAVVVNERLIRSNALTSIHVRQFTAEARHRPEGPERFTRCPPAATEELCVHLDESGAARVGAEVRPGDVLVGKVAPGREGCLQDASLVLPTGYEGKVVAVERQSRRLGFDLPAGVEQRVRVVVAVRRDLKVGDKLANRHGAKGVVGLIVPAEDMPHLADGTPVDIVYNPLAVPSRMNIGQLMEAHASLAARALGVRLVSPPLGGAGPEDVRALLKEAGLPEDGRVQLYDGRTGRPFDQRSTVGFVYWRKLDHMADDAFQARSTGAYDPATQQPVRGRKLTGGQKVGKMEIWALQSHGAVHNLREFLSIKADDALGRARIYDAIAAGREGAAFSAPESANRLLREVRAAALDLRYTAGGAAVNVDKPYDIGTVDEVRIAFASPEAIRAWSRGEVVSDATFDAETGDPAAGGLFCPRIFGPPDADPDSRERFQRMGHIDLAVPVVHPWLLAAEPSPLCALLGLDGAGIERIVYYRGDGAKGGGRAVGELLAGVDVAEAQSRILRDATPETRPQTAEALALLDALGDAPAPCRHAILEAVPVLPAGLRPRGPSSAAPAAADNLNSSYAQVIRCNNRLKAMLSAETPAEALRDACRQLQEAVDRLFGDGPSRSAAPAGREAGAASLADRLQGVRGRFVQSLAGKRADYSARSVIAPGTGLRFDQCGVPKELALELFRPFVVRELLQSQEARARSQAEHMISRGRREAYRALRRVVRDKAVLLVRAPALHKYSILAFQPVLTNERAIRIHPNVTIGFNADFDGDQMTIHVPLSQAAHEEAKRLLTPPGNLFATASGAMMNRPSQDVVLGCYYMTIDRPQATGEGATFAGPLAARNAWKAGRVDCHAKVRVALAGGEIETTVGRILFNELLPEGLRFVNEPVGRGELEGLLTQCYLRCGRDRAVRLLDAVKEFGFHFATTSGVSIGCSQPYDGHDRLLAEADARVRALRDECEAGRISEQDRYLRTIDLWTDAQARMMTEVTDALARADGGFLPISLMVRSGARGSVQQTRLLFGMGGLLADTFGRIIELPMRDCMLSGLGEMSYFLRSNGARAGLAMTILRTASAGDLMRRIVEALGDVVVVASDCGTTGGIEVPTTADPGRTGKGPASGRFAAEDVRAPDGRTVLPAGEEISDEKLAQLAEAGIEQIRVRSPITCRSRGGVCAKCYGHNVAQKRLVEVGSPVGISAALSLGEPLAQLTMRSFHLGHKYPFGKIARGKPEQDIKYSSGFPRLEEVFELFEKRKAYGPALDGVDERPSAQSVLDGSGAEAARQYVLAELARVYGEAGVRINSKHYEIAVRQMMSYVEVADPGGTGLIPSGQIHRDELAAANEQAQRQGRKSAAATPLLLPISEVALRTGSFLAASASWRTLNVLTQAAAREDVDPLKGMRENIILGRLIPVGAKLGGSRP